MKRQGRPARDKVRRNRPPVERMLRIHQLIQAGEYPNANTIAQRLEVSAKSVHRDLDFMKDRLELPMDYDPIRHGYFYTQEVGSFPTLQISEGELFALLVAEKALQQYRGTSFERPLVSAFKKIATALPDTISLNLADWEQTISFRTSAEPILNLRIFDALSRAVAKRQEVLLSYRKAGQKSFEPRMVNPLHLANINGEWFLFAHCHLRNDIRTFVPARIESVQQTGRRFERPQKFSLEKRLRASFGVHSAQGEFEVRIRFNEMVADYIREKRWHPSQALIESPDGGVELRLKLSSLVEVERWLLGWAGNAEVLAPPELRESIRCAALRTVEAYSDAGSSRYKPR